MRWLLLFLVTCSLAASETPSNAERVRVQLNWFHQFQFAGLYAAELRGYFRDEALEVELAESVPNIDIPQELALGRCQFAIYDSRILSSWAIGQDLALVAIIFQRNPAVLLVHEDSPYLSLKDALDDPMVRLVGPANSFDTELQLSLRLLGRDPQQVFPRRKQPQDLAAFAARELDVLPGYRSHEPFRLRRMGVPTRILRQGADVRSPFFGDVLVCRGDLLRSRPDLVARMRRAVLRGWDWALDNREALTRQIPSRWTSSRQESDPDLLREEADAIEALIDREVIALGTVSVSRLESIAALLRGAGLPGMVRRDLVWEESDPASPWLRVLAWGLALAGVVCVVLLAIAWATRRRLISSTLSHQRIMDLAEAFFLFHARVDERGRMRFDQASPSMTTILGGSRSAYFNDPDALLQQVVADDRRPLLIALSQAIDQRQPVRQRFRIRHPDHDRLRHLLMHAVPLPGSQPLEFDGLVLDLTAEAEAAEALLDVQHRLQTAQRNESLGLLAGGIAHDFNNLLGAMRGNAELALDRLPEDHESRPRVERVMQAVDRAAMLVKQILAYAGKGSIEPRPIDLAEECRVLRDLLKHTIPASVRIDLQIEEGLPKVSFDPAQLQQVLINLIVNGAESYQGGPGILTIRLQRPPDKADMVRIEIEDRGCGMDAETQARMFEPYFTTKRTGHGLGLAAVQGIVNASGAHLSCRSAIGQGTIFTVLLPLAVDPSTAVHHDSPHPVDGSLLLLADDDDAVREATAQMLCELGYTVDAVSGGNAALQRLADPSRLYVAAIIDCAMPDRAGTEVVRERRAAGDRRPMLLISGMVQAARIGTGVLDRRTRYLAKPFSRAMLDRMLRIVLRLERGGDSDESSASTYAALRRESSLQLSTQNRPRDT